MVGATQASEMAWYRTMRFDYEQLTQHFEGQIATFMRAADSARSVRERKAFENNAKGAMRAYATLVWPSVRSLGADAETRHREDYARMLEIVGQREVADSLRRNGSV